MFSVRATAGAATKPPTLYRLVGSLFSALPTHLTELNHVPLRVDGIAHCDTVE